MGHYSFIAADVDCLWKTALAELIGSKETIDEKGNKTYEKLGFSFHLIDINNNILLNPIRRFDTGYAAGEFLWYIRKDNTLKSIQYYAPSYDRFSDDGFTLHGAYGPRMHLGVIAELLQNKPNTRQAVLPIFRHSDLGLAEASKDIPCTLSLQFLCRDHALHCVTTMRSNDAWLGFPYDVFTFTTIQKIIANTLGLKYGEYIHNVGSFHLYDKNLEKAKEAAKMNDFKHSFVFEDPDPKFNLINALITAESEQFMLRTNNYRIIPKIDEICGLQCGDLLIACWASNPHARHKILPRSGAMIKTLMEKYPEGEFKSLYNLEIKPHDYH